VIHLHAAEVSHEISSRPSDAIALAVRVGSPIFAEEAVLDEAGQVVEEEEDSEAVVDEFRQFLDNVNPDDFAS